jgi:hypothetical protein
MNPLRSLRNLGKRLARKLLRRISSSSPIIIYQMGKVGSTTVYKSLKNANLYSPIYHVHFLSWEGIKNAEDYFLSLQNPIVPAHIERSKRLREEIDRAKDTRWRVITLVREPIGRQISDFFQNAESYYPDLIDENGNVKIHSAIECLRNAFVNFDEKADYACTWFDKELNRVFHVNVYDYPFNYHDGFLIIREQNIDCLVLRMEDLDRSFNDAISEFLGIRNTINMLKSNVSEEKKHSDAYRYVFDNITIPKSVCMRIYSSEYARHFYTESMRRDLIRRWSIEE